VFNFLNSFKITTKTALKIQNLSIITSLKGDDIYKIKMFKKNENHFKISIFISLRTIIIIDDLTLQVQHYES